MSNQNTIREDVRPPLNDQHVAAQVDDLQLNDAELAETAGGVHRPAVRTISTIYIGYGVECGERDSSSGVITYRPCPRCNKPMHTKWYQAKWYCTPCDFSEWRPRRETWNGTADTLIAAAK